MTTAPTCEYCGGDLRVTETVRARESTGFGLANERIRTFCSTTCRARWQGVDPVIASSQQSTLALFRDGVDRHDPAAVVWSA
ncbi:hypothetical protein [Natrinema hispanicum]|uniref:hypothetical protein n=1 Tax=Natrinema hispanicum TaxID=392421 RepID=UPI00102ACD87|nr:hypothetical protein [Natrinema hispanicum]